MAGIVDYMNQNWMDSSYNNRKKLAAQYWISDYSWTDKQNNQLLKMIKNWWNNNVKDNQTISNNVKWNISASKSWYDYSANLNTDKKRAAEMKQHLEEYMKSDPSLFKNRWAFESFFDYNWAWRDATQKALLDEYWNKANKYWLNSYENNVADNYSNVARQNTAEKQKNMWEALTKLYDLVWAVQDRFDSRMRPLRDELSSQTAKYLQEEADLKKLATDWYNKQVEANNFAKGWEMMSMASRMSWSWLSTAAIASSVQWVDNKWKQEYANLFGQHFNRLKELSTTYNNMYQAIWNTKNNLTQQEKDLMTNNLQTIWWWLESYVQLGNEWADDAYSPYKTILWQKVSGIWETANTEAKAQDKQSEYEACTSTAQRADMIARNLQQVLWEWVYSTYYSQIQAAANAYPNDFRKALYAAVDKLWLTKAGWSNTPNPDPNNPDTSDPFAKYRNKDWSINWTLYFNDGQNNTNNNTNILDSNISSYLSN